MNQNLTEMSNTQLKDFIKANRDNEQACHEDLKILLGRSDRNTVKYPANLPNEEMQIILAQRLNLKNK